MPERLYGIETEKAIQNFGRGQLPADLIIAYAEVKKAALMAIQEFERRFSEPAFEAIMQATNQIIEGRRNDQFPLPLKQGGAGTSVNMNINEVIANLAGEIWRVDHGDAGQIDPIEDINRFQSTNDTFPTAVTIVLLRHLAAIEKKVIELQETLIRKEGEYGSILMAGRTEMQDALPITLGQVFAGWAGGIERDRWRLHKLKERIRSIAMG